MTLVESIKYAAQNPFGIDFIYDSSKSTLNVPVGSLINCLGYNDFLEKGVGITRIFLAIFVVVNSNNSKEKMIAGLHLARGVLELNGGCEGLLLGLDILATIYHLGMKIIASPNRDNVNGQTAVRVKQTTVQNEG